MLFHKIIKLGKEFLKMKFFYVAPIIVTVLLGLSMTGCVTSQSSTPSQSQQLSSTAIQSEPITPSASDEQSSDIEIVEPVQPQIDKQVEQTILAAVKTLLEDYKNNNIDTTVTANSEPGFEEMPQTFKIPEITSYAQLNISQNPMTGDFFATIQSIDDKWQMIIGLNAATFVMSDGTVKEPDYAPKSSTFLEL